MKLEILVIAAHPDDAELGCGGTIAKHVAWGMKVGILDLTEGELGTRGSVEVRRAEAAESSKILKLTVRDNLKLSDGFFQSIKETQLKIIQKIRQHQPEIILANAIRDRHPDHGKAASLIHDACFLSGLIKIETYGADGIKQEPWRPKNIYHYIQSEYITPDFIVDVTDVWQTKMQAIKAYKTQFYDPNNIGIQTFISNPEFLAFLEARAIELGTIAGVRYAEGYTTIRYPVVHRLTDIY